MSVWGLRMRVRVLFSSWFQSNLRCWYFVGIGCDVRAQIHQPSKGSSAECSFPCRSLFLLFFIFPFGTYWMRQLIWLVWYIKTVMLCCLKCWVRWTKIFLFIAAHSASQTIVILLNITSKVAYTAVPSLSIEDYRLTAGRKQLNSQPCSFLCRVWMLSPFSYVSFHNPKTCKSCGLKTLN